MLSEKQLDNLRERFNRFSDDDLLSVLTRERRNYSSQAIEIADDIAGGRTLEYEIPEFADESNEPEVPWYINVGFILLFAVVIGLQFYFSSIYERTYSAVIGSTLRNILILYLGYKSVTPSKFSLIFLVLTAIALISAIFGQIIITLLTVAFMYFLKYVVFKKYIQT